MSQTWPLRLAAVAATKQPVGQNFPSVVGQISFRSPPILSPRKGRWPSSPDVGMGCGGRGGIVRAMGSQGGINSVSDSRDVPTSGAEAYGEVVWF